MSRRAKTFERFMGATVTETTANILSNNSAKVNARTLKVKGEEIDVADTWPMTPAKAQRIAASLHSTKRT